MSVNIVLKKKNIITPNHEAYLLLRVVVERVGMWKSEFLARLAELGYSISDDTFTNWGRPGRAFPRDWPMLRAMVCIISDPTLRQRCTAPEALRFFRLTGLPFSELQSLEQLFPTDEFTRALIPYLPESLIERISGIEPADAPLS